MLQPAKSINGLKATRREGRGDQSFFDSPQAHNLLATDLMTEASLELRNSRRMKVSYPRMEGDATRIPATSPQWWTHAQKTGNCLEAGSREERRISALPAQTRELLPNSSTTRQCNGRKGEVIKECTVLTCRICLYSPSLSLSEGSPAYTYD